MVKVLDSGRICPICNDPILVSSGTTKIARERKAYCSRRCTYAARNNKAAHFTTHKLHKDTL